MKSEKFTASQRQEKMNDTDKKSKIIAIMYSCPLSASLYLKWFGYLAQCLVASNTAWCLYLFQDSEQSKNI